MTGTMIWIFQLEDETCHAESDCTDTLFKLHGNLKPLLCPLMPTMVRGLIDRHHQKEAWIGDKAKHD